jgi:hypothetical protein
MSQKETEFRLDISRGQAEALDKQGKDSQERRGKTSSQAAQFVTPTERSLMDRAGKASDENRTHATERLADEYAKK